MIDSSSLFPYPLPETLKIGSQDPLDYQWEAQTQVCQYKPGWWREITPKGTKIDGRKAKA